MIGAKISKKRLQKKAKKSPPVFLPGFEPVAQQNFELESLVL